jgi:hypothetical protein
MSDKIRSISVSLEDGERQSAGKVTKKFFNSVDDAFRKHVVEVTQVTGENPEAAPAHLSFKTDADPEAMTIEVEWMAATHFNHVSATVVPTDEEMQEAMETIEEDIEESI